jgi:hypothetical protein
MCRLCSATCRPSQARATLAGARDQVGARCGAEQRRGPTLRAYALRAWRTRSASAMRRGVGIEFLAIFGDLGLSIWLSRAKSWPYPALYGTEGLRFES